MLPSKQDLGNQKKLKQVLQSGDASSLEKLAAILIGKLLGVSIAIAKSGFQYGADAGPAGQQGRRFRLECKKYRDTTSLNNRELLGEIDHALSRDENLEAWVLITTRGVPEQLRQDLIQKGERIGVPILIIDWQDNDISPLAALCAFSPELVEAEYLKEAGALARELEPVAAEAIILLERSFEPWCLGFDSLRSYSHQKLDAIWNSSRVSNAELGQNAAGGMQENRVKRAVVHDSLNGWWKGAAQKDAPAAIVGWDGVGKTWAALDWLISNKNEQLIVLVVPSSAVPDISGMSVTSIKQFLAGRLYEISGVRDQRHWQCRLDNLLKRPLDEGAVLTIFFDGLNQEPSVSWLALFKVLQSDPFAGRVRVLISTRKYHFDEKLSQLQGLVESVVPITVDKYCIEPGGEFDEMLAFEGIKRADLHPDLIELARTPRLFNLVVRFREKMVDVGQVTVHRLLWEYGRDSFGDRAGKSFSENEWKAWLQEIAKKCRDGIQEFSVRSLGETTSRPDLTECEIYARLSDIIDGRFAISGSSGELQLTPTVVAHSLGSALLVYLQLVSEPSLEKLDIELMKWLDPIAGFDQKAEILRAAVSILVEQGSSSDSFIAGALVTAWLQTQNITDEHRQELAGLASDLTSALLDAVEQSQAYTHASARLWAVNALRQIPRKNEDALHVIVIRVRYWFSKVSRDVNSRRKVDEEFETRRAERLKNKIGVDVSGAITVVGVELELVDQCSGVLQSAAPSIIEGFPLVKLLKVFETAAVVLAVKGGLDGWDGLKWLCFLNEDDTDEVALALRNLSDVVSKRVSESGVHLELPMRVASLLLYLTGREKDEDLAVSKDPCIDRFANYEEDYLQQPGHSIFYALERRHAGVALADKTLPLFRRVQRAQDLWFDPSFEPPESFVDEIKVMARQVEVEKLDRHISCTIDDINFETFEPVIARCAPDLLADLIRRKIRSIDSCPEESRYWGAINVTDYLLLTGKDEAKAAKTLRISGSDPDDSNEDYAASRLLIIELKGMGGKAQIEEIIKADLKFITTDFSEIICDLAKQDVDDLINSYEAGSDKQRNDLLCLLSLHRSEFSEYAWSWISGFAMQDKHEFKGLAFKVLACSDAGRFGRDLLLTDWVWDVAADFWVNHYGTGALIEATYDLPFEQVASRFAPSRLLESIRLRSSESSDVRIASEIFGVAIMANGLNKVDPGSELSVDKTRDKSSPYVLSIALKQGQEGSEDIMDPDLQLKSHRRAVDTAISRIRVAQASGASLYLANIDAADFDLVLQYAPDIVDIWLEGFQSLSVEFCRRVHLAESAFISLCESMLKFDSVRGVELWRALHKVAVVSYIGEAGLDDLLHAVFRAPDVPEVIALREELHGIKFCHTDKALFELAVVASYNGHANWLKHNIEKDRKSNHVWRNRRAKALEGFTINNSLPIDGAWPDGEISTTCADQNRKFARMRSIEACAQHWWKVFLKSKDSDEAYAAWVLFLLSADQRAWVWMKEEIDNENDGSSFFNLKVSHVHINHSKLKRAMEKRVKKLDKNFLDRKVLEGIGPWGMDAN